MDQRISDMFDKLNDNASLDVARSEMADLIRQILTDCGDNLGSWEKSCIGGAIGALSSNLLARDTLRDTWLRLCLVNLDNALIPPEHRNEEYAPVESALSEISCHDLRAAIDSIA